MKKFKNLLLVLSVGLGLGMISGVAHTGGFTNEVRRVEAAETKSGSYVFAEGGYTNGQDVSSIVIDGFTFSFDKGTSSNTPKYYDIGTGLRLYSGNIATVGTSASKVITKIVLTFSGTSYIPSATSLTNCTFASSNSAVTATYTVVDDSKAFSFGVNKTVRIKSIDVYTDTKATINSVSLNKASTSLEVGATETLTATVDPAGSELLWESSDSSVASVSNGVVTALDAGTTTIKVSAKADSTKYATCEVTVTKAQVAVQDAFASVKTEAGLSFGYTETTTGVAPVSYAIKDHITGTYDIDTAAINETADYTLNLSSTESLVFAKPATDLSGTDGRAKFWSIKDGSNELRIYEKTAMTLNLSADVEKIEVTCNTAEYATKLVNTFGSSVASSTNEYVTITPEGKTTLTATATAQIRIKSFNIVYKSTSTYSDFKNIKMKFRYSFDPSYYTGTVSEQGFVVTNDSTYVFESGYYTNDGVADTALDSMLDAGKKLQVVSKPASVTTDTFTLGINIPVSTEAGYEYLNCHEIFYVAAYIVVDGTYHFATPINDGNGYSVDSIITKYLSLSDSEVSPETKDLLTALQTEINA